MRRFKVEVKRTITQRSFVHVDAEDEDAALEMVSEMDDPNDDQWETMKFVGGGSFIDGVEEEPRSPEEPEIKERAGPPTTGASLDRFAASPSKVFTVEVPRFHKMLDLSTSHMPKSHPEWGDLRVAEHLHGWIVFVDSSMSWQGVPEWLMPIWKVAAVAECILINFDRDAEKYKQFKTYDW